MPLPFSYGCYVRLLPVTFTLRSHSTTDYARYVVRYVAVVTILPDLRYRLDAIAVTLPRSHPLHVYRLRFVGWVTLPVAFFGLPFALAFVATFPCAHLRYTFTRLRYTLPALPATRSPLRMVPFAFTHVGLPLLRIPRLTRSRLPFALPLRLRCDSCVGAARYTRLPHRYVVTRLRSFPLILLGHRFYVLVAILPVRCCRCRYGYALPRCGPGYVCSGYGLPHVTFTLRLRCHVAFAAAATVTRYVYGYVHYGYLRSLLRSHGCYGYTVTGYVPGYLVGWLLVGLYTRRGCTRLVGYCVTFSLRLLHVYGHALRLHVAARVTRCRTRLRLVTHITVTGCDLRLCLPLLHWFTRTHRRLRTFVVLRLPFTRLRLIYPRLRWLPRLRFVAAADAFVAGYTHGYVVELRLGCGFGYGCSTSVTTRCSVWFGWLRLVAVVATLVG